MSRRENPDPAACAFSCFFCIVMGVFTWLLVGVTEFGENPATLLYSLPLFVIFFIVVIIAKKSKSRDEGLKLKTPSYSTSEPVYHRESTPTSYFSHFPILTRDCFCLNCGTLVRAGERCRKCYFK